MADENKETLAPEMEQASVDDWAAAFAALDQSNKGDTETDPDTGEAGDNGKAGEALPDTEGADQGEGSPVPEAGDGEVSEELSGGPGDLGGEDGPEDVRFDWGDIDVSEEGIQRFREELTNDIRERAINDVARAYIERGARHTNGRLGATINDPDICQRDSDGVPRFYNPETRREFTGDNPRKQAQEWVDYYNKELAEAFNKTCSEYSQKLFEKDGVRLAVVEFAPKYNQLDPMRRSMFEAVIEDYEVTDDNGDVIGYSCDLDKALGAVNRQVAAIQRQYKSQQAKAPTTPPSGPALDTPSTGSNAGGSARPQFKSIAEAMEWEQDQLLAKMRNK